MESVNVCNIKHTEKLFAYCYNESIYLCEECYKNSHRMHRIDFVTLLAQDYLKSCKTSIEDSTRVMQEFNTQLASHSKAKLFESSKANIEDYCKAITVSITKYCESLISQLPQLLHSQAINIERISKSMFSGRDLLQSVIGKLKQCKDQLSCHVSTNNYKWFIEHVKQLKKMESKMTLLKENFTKMSDMLADNFKCCKIDYPVSGIINLINKSIASDSIKYKSPSKSALKSTKKFSPKDLSYHTPKHIASTGKSNKYYSRNKGYSIKSVTQISDTSTCYSPKCEPFIYSSDSKTQELISFSPVKCDINKEPFPCPDGSSHIWYEGNFLMSTGGEKNSIILNDSFSYNIKTALIITNAPMHVSRKYHSSVFIKSDIYIIGGYNHSEQILAKMEKYNLTNKEWSECCSMNSPRNLHTSCNYNNLYIYVFGGCLSQKQSVERYEVSNGKWSPIYINHTITRRFGMGSMRMSDECIMIFGGLNKCEYFDDVFEFNPVTFAIAESSKIGSKDSYYNREPRKLGNAYYIFGYPSNRVHKFCNGEWTLEYDSAV